jgi:3-hydroxybutyryl-CoA dehydrogenase
VEERVGVAGSGAIACGVAATASTQGDVILWARSDRSAERARATLEKVCGKLEGADAARVTVVTDLDALADATVVVEAIAEDLEAKTALWQDIARRVSDSALMATTTSSLSVEAIAEASGDPSRFIGLHVFNPVPRMKLVELIFPKAASDDTRDRARALCAAWQKEAVEIPDVPGFVVNRLLFPYLFSAVTLMEETGLEPAAIDTCMKLGAGHPMGPLALIDFVGLDVSKAIAESIGTPVPSTIDRLIAAGALGRKAGRGFYDYDS